MRRFGALFILCICILIVRIGMAHAALDDGLVGYWSFDGCNFQDDSDANNDGVVGGGSPDCVEGAIGMAFDYNGNTDFVRIPGVTIPSSQHSFSMWIRPDRRLTSGSTRQDILYADLDSLDDILNSLGRPHITFNHDNDGKIGFHARIEGESFDNIKTDTTTWQAGRWYHLSFTWDGTRFRTYVDGNQQQSRTNRSGPSQSYTGLVLGKRGRIDFPFRGAIDEVRIYNRVITATEVRTLAVAEFPLTVSVSGAGNGVVTSDPGGIACEPDCDAFYNSDVTIALTAEPEPDSDFIEWTGNGCSGDNPVCTLDMDEDREVNARFELKRFRLAVNKTGSGDGTVRSTPSGVNCGNDCRNRYTINTEVTLTAESDSNSIFTGWKNGEGEDIASCPGTDPCTVTMTEELTIQANFLGRYTLTLSTNGTGAGTIISNPPGINCGNDILGTDDCEETFIDGESILLTATPAADSQFVRWNGGICSGSEPCAFEIDRNREVAADFENPLPTAMAGDDQIVNEETLVTLDGNASFDFGDPDGASLSYSWSQIRGVPVTLIGAETATPTFTAPDVRVDGGVLEFELTVTDSRGLTSTANANNDQSIIIRVLDTNISPVANAGEDQTVDENSLVSLDGTASTDANDGIETFAWTQLSGPPVTLSDPDTAQPTFTAPDVGPTNDVLVFTLTVTDVGGLESSDTISVNVIALFPLSVSTTGSGGGTITANPSGLDCGNTCDVTYRNGTPVTLIATPSPDSRFIVWSGACTGALDCIVTMTEAQMVTAEFENPAPTANAGPDQIVEEGTAVVLDASASADFNSTPLTYEWMQTSGPPVTLSNPTAIQPAFTAPIVGLSAGFQPGDTLPGFVLTSNPAGSIADVRARGDYANGQWTVMLTRSLATSDDNGDVQFDLTDATHLYPFSIAYLDNTGAAPPGAAAVMTTQDTTPYTLGNEASTAQLKAQPETPSDCAAFTGTPLITTPADPTTVPSLTLKAAYDATHIYICIIAPDPNGIADDLKEHWEYLGPESDDWERKAGSVNTMGGVPGSFDEDRIAIWWDINAQDFATEGCMALCHNLRMQSRNLDGQADLWHWKAARTHLAGFAEDQGLSADPEHCPDAPCRQRDTSQQPITTENQRLVDMMPVPSFIANDGPRAMVRALFSDAVPNDCLAAECDLAVPATLLDEFLEFGLTVTDERTLTATDRVVIQVVEAGGNDTDADGISNEVEDGAPNNGDGNADGVPDRRQAQVASLPNHVDGRYVTLEAPPGITLVNVRAVPNPSPSNAPADIDFPVGFFEFTAEGMGIGDATTITLILPADIVPETYYKFGPTPANPTPTWYEFAFNGTTGADQAVQNSVVLHFVDGQRGDNDLSANGELQDPGAVAIMAPPPPPPTPTPPPVPRGGGGGGGGCTLSPDAPIDPTLLMLLGLIIAYLGWRRSNRTC